ncbi:MAG: Stp1/IreP family PP2C-type Ser/Thr phosphatase [Oscillospiraceae bacterium]|nr:Stp1/IreP family PP2C-type Ser/Thr phosphatase [Oscillospiraceae bacterium]
MQSWGLTDPGCVRTQNQDAFQIVSLDRSTLLCVICDGMGGAKSGNIASALAIDVFVQEVKRVYKSGMNATQIEQMLRGGVKLANFTVYDQAQEVQDFVGMGTTLVAACISGRRATIVNVGDSRCYLVNEDGIRQVTTDHSLVQMMIRRRELTEEQARFYPGKNYITRAIGTEPTVECDSFHCRLERGDALLLCSDGLSGVMDDQEMLFEIVHGVNKANCCQRLLDIAKSRGAPDNVTSILVIA